MMEQVAQALTTGAAAGSEVARRPLFGPTRVSVLRRVNARCLAGAPKGEEVVVEALVQSGTVCEGQVLHAQLPAPIANRARDGPQPASAPVTLAVVNILRFDKPRYRPRVLCACACACALSRQCGREAQGCVCDRRTRATAGEYVGLRLRLEHSGEEAETSDTRHALALFS